MLTPSHPSAKKKKKLGAKTSYFRLMQLFSGKLFPLKINSDILLTLKCLFLMHNGMPNACLWNFLISAKKIFWMKTRTFDILQLRISTCALTFQSVVILEGKIDFLV